MFSTHVPKHFWGEAVLTVTYLINRMSSWVLNFQTPCQVIFNSYPRTWILSTIPIRVFGCSAFGLWLQGVGLAYSMHGSSIGGQTKCRCILGPND